MISRLPVEFAQTASDHEGQSCIKHISKQQYAALQSLEPRCPNNAKLIVCVEYLANEFFLAIGRSNTLLCHGLKGGKISGHLGEVGLDFGQFCLAQPGIG